jgi:hypothetical protein
VIFISSHRFPSLFGNPKDKVGEKKKLSIYL